MVDYILKRSKRRTVALYIRNGGLEVRAPLKFPKRDIDKFVASKEKMDNGQADKVRRTIGTARKFFS